MNGISRRPAVLCVGSNLVPGIVLYTGIVYRYCIVLYTGIVLCCTVLFRIQESYVPVEFKRLPPYLYCTGRQFEHFEFTVVQLCQPRVVLFSAHGALCACKNSSDLFPA